MTLALRTRNVDRFPGRHEFASVEALESADHVPAGVLCIADGDSWIDVLYEPAGHPTTAVYFYGAIDRLREPSPSFRGDRVLGDTATNRIRIYDPVLYANLSVSIGWYAGTRTQRLQQTLPRVIAKLTSAAGGSRTLMFGGSAGGFAALHYSRDLDALTVAINPQTVILRYPAIAVARYAVACLGATDVPSIPAALEQVHGDLPVLYATGHRNRIVYVQNDTDPRHIEYHLQPLLDVLSLVYDARGFDSDRLSLLMGSWGDGHVPPLVPQMTALLAAAVATPGTDWSQLDTTALRAAVGAYVP